MLRRVSLTTKGENPSACVVLLGGFDGLHTGHKKLVAIARSYGLPIGAMTIVGGKSGKSLFTFAERERSFLENGIDFVMELPFSEIRDLSPESFLEKLTTAFAPQAFVCGDDFRFGKGALGTIETIKRYTQVRVERVKLVEIDGEKVSTGTIKKRLETGDIVGANELLGEEFFLTGIVEKDRQVGRTIGFPTANIAYPDEKFPLKKGVYETRIAVDGKEYRAITNFGARPTFLDERVWTESYLDGFNGDLYGRELTVRFVSFLREIQKFESADALKTALETDIRRIRE